MDLYCPKCLEGKIVLVGKKYVCTSCEKRFKKKDVELTALVQEDQQKRTITPEKYLLLDVLSHIKKVEEILNALKIDIPDIYNVPESERYNDFFSMSKEEIDKLKFYPTEEILDDSYFNGRGISELYLSKGLIRDYNKYLSEREVYIQDKYFKELGLLDNPLTTYNLRIKIDDTVKEIKDCKAVDVVDNLKKELVEYVYHRPKAVSFQKLKDDLEEKHIKYSLEADEYIQKPTLFSHKKVFTKTLDYPNILYRILVIDMEDLDFPGLSNIVNFYIGVYATYIKEEQKKLDFLYDLRIAILNYVKPVWDRLKMESYDNDASIEFLESIILDDKALNLEDAIGLLNRSAELDIKAYDEEYLNQAINFMRLNIKNLGVPLEDYDALVKRLANEEQNKKILDEFLQKKNNPRSQFKK